LRQWATFPFILGMLHRGILGLTLALALTAPAQAEYTFRPISTGSGIGTVNGIVKGDGAGNPSAAVAGTDYVAPSANLTALLAMGVGCAGHSGASAWTARTITGTAGQITVTNGDCTLGNPTISLPAAMSLAGIVVTGGTFNGGAFNGTLGATTPAAANLTSLNVSGTAGALTGTAVFLTPSMSNGQQNIVGFGNAFSNNNGFGLVYNHNSTTASRFLALQALEAAVGQGLTITAGNNVGVGTSAPRSSAYAVKRT
jgi:hypothetical protein